MKFDLSFYNFSAVCIGGEGDDYMGRAFLTASVRTIVIIFIASYICTEYCE